MNNEVRNQNEESAENMPFDCETSLNWKWLQEEIRVSLKTTAKFGQQFNIERIGVGQGYMSLIERVHPMWTEMGERLPGTLIIKLPSTEPSRRALASTNGRNNYFSGIDTDMFLDQLECVLRNYHNTEVTFYEMMKANKLHLKVPDTYVLQRCDSEINEGVIVMEDMGEDSIVFTTYDMMTLEDMYQVMDELAKLHAFCLDHSEWNAIKGISIATSIRRNDERQMMLTMFKAMQHLAEEKLAPLIDQIICNHWERICDTAEIVDNLHRVVGLPLVLIHGDLRSTNIIWKQHNGRKTLSAIIDWQLAHPGCAVEDIARILICSLSSCDRRRYWRNILRYYYEKLEERHERKLPFSLDKLKKSFLLIYPFALAMIAPSFGPGMREDIEANHPDRSEELLQVMRDKAIGIAQDILHFSSLNLSETDGKDAAQT